MTYRTSVLTAAVVSLAFVGACSSDNDNSTGITSNASVGFINATGNTNLSVANNGIVGTGNGNLGFGASTSCMTVNTDNANGLSFTNASNGSAITGFNPTLMNGGRYTVIAYTGANGTTQFATLDNTYTPVTGQAGVRVFNAASGSGSLVANSGGSALNGGAGVAFGTNGSFFSMPAGTQSITFDTGTGTNTLGTASNLSLTAGQNYDLIVGPAATGSTTLRPILVSGC